MSKGNNTSDIRWYSCKRKRPVTYSTKCVSDSIKLCSEYLTVPVTPANLLRYIEENKLVGMYEEKEVLMKYIELGYEDEALSLQ